MILALIILFTLLGSLCSVGFAALLLLFKRKRLLMISGGLIPYAIGTLLGAAFFGMIPHALSQIESALVLPTVLAGIILFYVLEKFALWRHCHEQPCETHTRAGTMILIGDSLHNFVDGVAIAAAFGNSIPLGVAISVAVIAHEVPQEVGDFAILLESGFSKSRAIWYNILSSSAALPGAVVTYYLLPVIQSLVPYLLSVSAASFIYIALADLVPGRRTTGGLEKSRVGVAVDLLGYVHHLRLTNFVSSHLDLHMSILTTAEKRYAETCRNEFWKKVFRLEVEYLLVRLQGCRDILSVGCGPASIEGELSKRGFNVTGLDVSQQALDSAPDSIRTVAARAEDMSFPEESFDAAIYVASLQFIDDYPTSIEKTVRVLRPNGRIIVMLLNPKSLYFKERCHNPDSYVSRIKHTELKAIEETLSKRFKVHSEFFLHLEGNEVFASESESDAALYVVWGTKR